MQPEQWALLDELFERSPSFFAVLRGPNHRFEIAKESYIRLIGGRDILGNRVIEALHELRGQGFVPLLDTVLESGTPFVGRQMPAFLEGENGEHKQIYVDFVFSVWDDYAVRRRGVLLHGTDVTARQSRPARICTT